MMHDRADGTHLPYTHEFLANMLGSNRKSVTLAAQSIQEAGIINYRRGEIQVLDRRGLEKASCECYAIVRARFDAFSTPLAAFLAALTGCRAVPFQRTPSVRGSSWQRLALPRSPAGAVGRDILELGGSTFGTDKGERPIAKTKPGSKAPFEERFQSLTNSR
jgi:Crp-like helix-turn-helix domain